MWYVCVREKAALWLLMKIVATINKCLSEEWERFWLQNKSKGRKSMQANIKPRNERIAFTPDTQHRSYFIRNQIFETRILLHKNNASDCSILPNLHFENVKSFNCENLDHFFFEEKLLAIKITRIAIWILRKAPELIWKFSLLISTDFLKLTCFNLRIGTANWICSRTGS